MHNNTKDELQKSLKRYSTLAETTLQFKRTTAVGGKWLSYTAAVSSALAMSATVDAAVIYSGIQNISIDDWGNTAIPSGADIDLNGDGINDISLAISYGQLSYGRSHGWVDFRPLNGAQGDARRLSSGNTISSGAGPWSPGRALLRSYRFTAATGWYSSSSDIVRISGDWPGATPPDTSSGFAGFRINAGDNVLNAWLRFSIENEWTGGPPTKLTLIDWAYEDAGAPILAGQTTSPVPLSGSLGLLAMGATGLAAFRRKKKQQLERNG